MERSSTESDERYFHTIKDIPNNTSNHHPDNMISNAFIRTLSGTKGLPWK